jgi:hypothetical protein
MSKINKLGEKEEDCHDNIFPEIHFKDYVSLQKRLISTSSIRIYVKLDNWKWKVNGSLNGFIWFRYFWDCHSIELEKLHLWYKFDVVADLASGKNYAAKRYCIGKKVIFCPSIVLFSSDPKVFRCKKFRFVKNSKFWVK